MALKNLMVGLEWDVAVVYGQPALVSCVYVVLVCDACCFLTQRYV